MSASILLDELDDNPKLEKFINKKYAIYSFFHPLYIKRIYLLKWYWCHLWEDWWSVNFDSVKEAYEFYERMILADRIIWYNPEFITDLRFVREI